MLFRPLLMTDENKAKVQAVVDFATKPENYYKPPADFVPGERPEYRCSLDSYRCVFTITEGKGKRFRHLSISIPVAGKLPNVMAACTIATWFGFTGAPMSEDVATGVGADWFSDVVDSDNCVVLAQLLA
jgi:hypothetical protein